MIEQPLFEIQDSDYDNCFIIAYMCGTDFCIELTEGNADGVEVFMSEKACRAAKDCTDECGVVKVKIERV